MEILTQLLGILGAICLLSGYAMVSSGKLASHAPRFHLLNLAGAVGLIANSAWQDAMGPLFLNLVWCGIAMKSLWALRSRG